ncbi:MAG: MFS transporter [Clostridia bacterium]|nr:MFS transporter [Clostridia bacterium]MBQ8637515.1 MFS transporter [Clostridia bacterium]
MPERDKYKSSRIAYIWEAAFEYFISLIIAGAFLAKLLTKTGISDQLTGIITSFVSLAYVSQFFAVIFIRPTKPVKKWVTLLTFIKSILFVGLYMVPMLDIPQGVKTVLVVVFILGGQLIANVAVPFKTNWLMSLIDLRRRGDFTAKKEIVSLLGGMAFSYIMGAVSDHYTQIGNDAMAFVICQITVIVLGILHVLMLIVAREPEESRLAQEKTSLIQMLKGTFGNKTIRRIIYVNMLWSGFTYFSFSYFGVYQIKELGFSLTYVSVITIVSSFARVIVSRPLGRLADRTSWAGMMTLCFGIAAVAYLVAGFTVPSNGKWFYMIYSILYYISMAGINGGLINIVFDYADEKSRTAVLGIKTAIGGLCGFFSTIVGGWLLDLVQKNGNSLFGITVYAQQVLSFITFIGLILTIIYMRKVVHKLKKI